VPAALLVVAADGGWMPQTAEHVAALDALGVEHCLVAVTRSDLADATAVIEELPVWLAGTSLAGSGIVAVSATTGAGLPELRERLGQLVRGLPTPDPAAPVRLWIDRAFTIRGSGTVVTGTLGAGAIGVGDELTLFTRHGDRAVRVRGLQALGQSVERLTGVARVAVNLRGVDRDAVTRGDALLTPGAWLTTEQLDARLDLESDRSAGDLVLHLGSAAIPARLRPLGTSPMARLTLGRPLPVGAGDRALLRDPGRHLIAAGVTVLDVDPPALARRGAAARRAQELAELASSPINYGAELLKRTGTVRLATLRATGTSVPGAAVRAGEWLVDADLAARWREGLRELVEKHRSTGSLEPGPAVDDVRAALGAPDPSVVAALVQPPLTVRNGRLIDLSARSVLPPPIARAVGELELGAHPFTAPDVARLAELRLGARELEAAERAGMLLRVADGVVLPPDADLRAAGLLADLPQPFTVSEARQRLGASRRVAVPLLELMDRRQLTRRLPDSRRSLTSDPRD
jgi:selenocysteine-specific elongation factor